MQKVKVSYGFNISVQQGDKEAVVRDILGEVTYNKPEDLEEWKHLCGEGTLLSLIWFAVQHDIRRIAKALKKRGVSDAQVQETLNHWIPGISLRRPAENNLTKEELIEKLNAYEEELKKLKGEFE
jgi:hypothetical protein